MLNGMGVEVMPMDLSITPMGDSYRLLACSVQGMLWLQRRFEPSTWELICGGKVRLNGASIGPLCRDAIKAGLVVSRSAANAGPTR